MIMIFIVIIHTDKYSCLFSIQFFFVQTLSSILFILSFLSILVNWLVLVLSIIVKTGTWPFHTWIINLCISLSWKRLFFLITLQKIVPLYVLCSFYNEYFSSGFFFFFFFINIYVGWINCYSSSDLRLFLAYNSIIDQSWIVLGCTCLDTLGYLYIFTYTLFSYLLFINLESYYTKYVSGLSLDCLSNFNISSSLISLIGLPPSLGFFLKFIIIYELFCENHFYIIFLFILMKMVTLYFFFRPLSVTSFIASLSVNYNGVNFSKLPSLNLITNLFGFLILLFIYF